MLLEGLETREKDIRQELKKIDERLLELLGQYDQFPALKSNFKDLIKEFFGPKWLKKLPHISLNIQAEEETPLSLENNEVRSINHLSGGEAEQKPFQLKVTDNTVNFFHRSPYEFQFNQSEMEDVNRLLMILSQLDPYHESKKHYKAVISVFNTAEKFIDIMGVVVGGVAYLLHNYFVSLMITMGSHLFCLLSELFNTCFLEKKLETVSAQRKQIDSQCAQVLGGYTGVATDNVFQKMLSVILGVTRYPWFVFEDKFSETARVKAAHDRRAT